MLTKLRHEENELMGRLRYAFEKRLADITFDQAVQKMTAARGTDCVVATVATKEAT